MSRAGDVVGTPDWQVDMMYENESARIWEEENRHSKEWDMMLEAVGYMNVAIEHMDKVIECLMKAKDEVNGIPAEYRIGSLLETIEDLDCELIGMRQNFVNGGR